MVCQAGFHLEIGSPYSRRCLELGQGLSWVEGPAPRCEPVGVVFFSFSSSHILSEGAVFELHGQSVGTLPPSRAPRRGSILFIAVIVVVIIAVAGCGEMAQFRGEFCGVCGVLLWGGVTCEFEKSGGGGTGQPHP